MTVYPRWRGELSLRAGDLPAESGLSPLARGTQTTYDTPLSARRFIPAGAGNSTFLCIFVSLLSVYPRWRGELAVNKPDKKFAVGLSPLARGTHFPARPAAPPRRFIPAGAGTPFHEIRALAAFRFIPAGAGNSSSEKRSPDSTSVYPRWRGELAPVISARANFRGLSPLARGTL